MKKRLLVMTHLVTLGVGFVLGIYALPILTAPDLPPDAKVQRAVAQATFSGTFQRDLRGSDFLHWGEGQVAVGPGAISLMGAIAPGPDYRLYLSPEFVDDEESFQRVKTRAVDLGAVRTFKNFVVPLPDSIDATQYNTVVIWCEAFSEFITAARYQ